MSKAEQYDQPDIDKVIEAEREGSHPIGHRAVREVLEVTPLLQQDFEARTNVYNRGEDKLK